MNSPKYRTLLEGLLKEPMFGTQKERIQEALDDMEKRDVALREHIKVLAEALILGVENDPHTDDPLPDSHL